MYQIFIVLLFCLFNNLYVQAKALQELSFDQAMEIALENNPELRAVSLRLDINKAQIKTARARPDPVLFSDSGIAENTYRVGLSYNFEMGGKRKKRGAISETNLEQAEISLEEKLLNFRAGLRNAYAARFYSKEKLKLREELKTSYEELYEVSKRRESVGDIAMIDVLQVETVKLANENQYTKSLSMVKKADANLEYLLNTELDEDIDLQAPGDYLIPKDINQEELFRSALEDRPELKANQAAQKLTEQELDLAKTKRIPNLNLSAGPDFVTGSSGQQSVFVMAQINLPIFNLRKGEIEAAEAKQEQLLSEKEAQANKIKLEVKQDYLSYLSQKEILSNYDNKLIPTVKEYAEKRLRSFELGKSPIWIALDAQSQYIKTRLEYIDLSLEYQSIINSLERSIGAQLP